MSFMIALAVRDRGVTAGQALWSATAGGVKPLHPDDIGKLAVGSRADLAMLDAPGHLHIDYRPGLPIANMLVAPAIGPSPPLSSRWLCYGV
jgi:imidazolonepropionase